MKLESLDKVTLPTDSQSKAPIGVEIDSNWLLQGRQSITIVHNNERYLLRKTRQGKLILTK